ncbi:MAG: hypothetical protein ACHQ9S_00315 [Candidatus Binatia bacterium]
MNSKNERESLAATFDRHAAEEGKILAEYRTLSEKLGDSPAGFLVNHILTEEEMHHLLLTTVAKWLREHPSNQERVVPPGVNIAELHRLTQTLRKHETETIEACRQLKSQLPSADGDLLGTLLDVVMSDSEKHHRLLSSVEKMITR